jgi:methionyl-tRNA synthetase
MAKEKINFETFLEIGNKLEIKIGMIRSVERVPKSDKMLKLEVSFGDDDRRTVMTNIGNRINDIEELEMLQLPFITNLEPTKIMGVVSEAMIMVAENENGVIEIKDFTNGSKLL